MAYIDCEHCKKIHEMKTSCEEVILNSMIDYMLGWNAAIDYASKCAEYNAINSEELKKLKKAFDNDTQI